MEDGEGVLVTVSDPEGEALAVPVGLPVPVADGLAVPVGVRVWEGDGLEDAVWDPVAEPDAEGGRHVVAGARADRDADWEPECGGRVGLDATPLPAMPTITTMPAMPARPQLWPA